MKNCYGESLTTLGTAIAIQISQCINIEDIHVLASLLTTIGDQLSFLATANERYNKCNKNELERIYNHNEL